MQKYARMLCWVRPHEKKELIEAVNGRFPIVFAKNYDDFKNQIKEDDYLIFSLSKTRFKLKKINELVDLFPENMFYLFNLKDNEMMYASQATIMDKENVKEGQYNAEDLCKNYLGFIKDLWEMRMSEPILVSY